MTENRLLGILSVLLLSLAVPCASQSATAAAQLSARFSHNECHSVEAGLADESQLIERASLHAAEATAIINNITHWHDFRSGISCFFASLGNCLAAAGVERPAVRAIPRADPRNATFPADPLSERPLRIVSACQASVSLANIAVTFSQWVRFGGHGVPASSWLRFVGAHHPVAGSEDKAANETRKPTQRDLAHRTGSLGFHRDLPRLRQISWEASVQLLFNSEDFSSFAALVSTTDVYPYDGSGSHSRSGSSEIRNKNNPNKRTSSGNNDDDGDGDKRFPHLPEAVAGVDWPPEVARVLTPSVLLLAIDRTMRVISDAEVMKFMNGSHLPLPPRIKSEAPNAGRILVAAWQAMEDGSAALLRIGTMVAATLPAGGGAKKGSGVAPAVPENLSEWRQTRKSAAWWSRVGSAFGEIGARREATACLAMAVATATSRSVVATLLNLGVSLKNAGHQDAALSAYKMALSYAPAPGERILEGTAQAAYNAGALLSEMGREQEALEMHNLAVAHDPFFPEPRYARAMVRSGLDRRTRIAAMHDLLQAESLVLTKRHIDLVEHDGIDDDSDDDDSDGIESESASRFELDTGSSGDNDGDWESLVAPGEEDPRLSKLLLGRRRTALETEAELRRIASLAYMHDTLNTLDVMARRETHADERTGRGVIIHETLRFLHARDNSTETDGTLPHTLRKVIAVTAVSEKTVPLTHAERNLLSRINTARALELQKSGDAASVTLAKGVLRRVMIEDPSYYHSYINTAGMYGREGRHILGLSVMRAALELFPDSHEVASTYGGFLIDTRHHGEALDVLERAVRLEDKARNVFGDELGDVSYPFCHLFLARLTTATWADWDHDAAVRRIRHIAVRQTAKDRLPAPGQKLGSCIHPFAALSYPLPVSDTLRIAYAHADRAERNARFLRGSPFRTRPLHEVSPSTKDFTPRIAQTRTGGERKGRDRIRVGFASSELRNHPLEMLVRPMLLKMDPERFQVTLYALTGDNVRSVSDATVIGSEPLDGSRGKVRNRERLAREAERFRDVSGMSPLEIANEIYKDGIDVLVNLDGYTSDHEVPEIYHLRPAPIIIAFMGYAGSLGDMITDYIVTDRIATPPRAQATFTEKFMYMPNSYYLNNYRSDHGDRHFITSRDDLFSQSGKNDSLAVPPEIKGASFVYASFCRPVKIDPHLFKLWMRIIESVPGSVLWLMGSEEVERGLKTAAGPLADRVVFSRKASVHDHLSRLPLADLMLDTAHYGGHTTTTDALFAGVPVLTGAHAAREFKASKEFKEFKESKEFKRDAAWPERHGSLDEKGRVLGLMPSRVASSIVSAAGLARELVAEGPTDYYQRAVYYGRCGRDCPALRRIRSKLGHGGPDALFDSGQWVRAFERGVTQAVERHLAKLPPGHIIIE